MISSESFERHENQKLAVIWESLSQESICGYIFLLTREGLCTTRYKGMNKHEEGVFER